MPTLYCTPEPFSTEMLRRIRAVLAQERSETTDVPQKALHIARDEAVVLPGPGHRVEIGGLAAALSNGEYFGILRSFDARYPEQSGMQLEKSGRSIALTVPGPGLFLLTISDSMKKPRIEFMIAVAPAKDSSVINSFENAHALLTNWREEDFAWPMHDFQRAYLKSLMLGTPPQNSAECASTTRVAAQRGVTAEPVFTPKPGILPGDTTVTLDSATPGAVIHYTVDSSQPLENSRVYHAPIIVKGIPQTIKAFAESPGMKDSPVVTGFFTVGNSN